MATFRAASSASFVATSGSITKPAGVVSGDVQLVCIFADNSGGTLGISGGATWTQVGTTQSITNGDTQTFAVFSQVAGGAEPASYTISSSAGFGVSAVMVAYSGVASGSPIAASLLTNPNSASPPASPVSIAANAITTTAASQTVVFFGGVDWNASTAAAFTDPASTTRRGVETPAQFTNVLAVDFVQASAGSTGTITATGTLAAATGNYGAALVALANAASGAPQPPETDLPFWDEAFDEEYLTAQVDSESRRANNTNQPFDRLDLPFWDEAFDEEYLTAQVDSESRRANGPILAGPPDDAWPWASADELDDDWLDQADDTDDGVGSDNNPAPISEDGWPWAHADEIEDEWQDLVDDTDDGVGADAVVAGNPPPDDAWPWASADELDDDWLDQADDTDDGISTDNNPAQIPEDAWPWAHADEVEDEWPADEAQRIDLAAPAAPPDDAWPWASADELDDDWLDLADDTDDGVGSDNNPAPIPEDAWPWSHADEVEDEWPADEAQRAAAAVASPPCPDDAWPWADADAVEDEWADAVDVTGNAVGADNAPALPPDDGWPWAHADEDLGDEGADLAAPLDPVAGPPTIYVKAEKTLRSPDRGVHLKSPDRGVHLKSPDRGVHLKSPDRGVHLKSPDRGTHLKSPDRGTHLKTPKRDT